MKQLALLALTLACSGCAGGAEPPLAPVKNLQYGAISHDPFWLVSIGDDRIVLTTASAGGAADAGLNSYAYPRVVPRTVNGVTRWDAGTGTNVLSLEARRGPCTTGGRRYPDRVTVYLSGRMMRGCGGPEMPEGRD